MDTRHRIGLAARACLAGAVGLALTACGGGGDGGTPPPGTIDITASNQDTLARAGMVALQAGVLGASIGVAGGGSPAGIAAASGRKRAAAVQPPLVEDCTVSGTTTTIYDDRDNSGTSNPGDAATITYNDCVEVAGEVMSGTAVAVYTQIQLGTPFSVGARITTNDLRTRTATRSVLAQGGFDFLLSAPSLFAASDSLRVSVPNSLTLAITTPVYADTVTLQAGYVLQSAYDATAVPPGGSVPGRTSTTASGRVSSATAAGTVLVNTLQPFVQYDVDPYPRSGQFEVVGKTGSLQANVLSTAQVQIDIDTDGNGVFDGTKIVPWADLF